MAAIAPALQAFFTDRLIIQRNSSPRTIVAYRDTFKLLLRFTHEQTGKQPFELDIDDLDAPLIGAFLTHLERDRRNSSRTRNARLGAIHSFYRFAALEHPEHAHTTARVMAIPTKRHERNTVSVRVSELVGLRVRDVHLGAGHHIRVLGKGRKNCATP
jgi:integrase/recombinase XerD